MARPPNVLWIMTDEQRTDSMGCYDSAWAQTPTIDRLASEGVRFTTAVTPAPVCLPARTSILSGRYPCDTGAWSNGSTRGHPTRPLTSVFGAAGYRTASFGKQHYYSDFIAPAFQSETDLVVSDEVDYDGYADRWNQDDFGVVQYPTGSWPVILAGRFPAEAEQRSEARAIAAAKAWLDETSAGGAPFFLRLSLNGPHTPVVPPAPFDTRIDPDGVDLPGPPDDLPAEAPPWLHDLATMFSASRLSDDQVRRMRQAYYGDVCYLDQLLGELLSWLDGRGLLDDLVIAFCSDHGTHLGDFGLVQKNTFFEPVVNVPYFFWAPGVVREGSTIRTPVEVRTLLPTLLELAGLDVPSGCATSLAPALTTGEEPEAAPVYSEFTFRSFGTRHDDHFRLMMVRDGPWKLSLCADPEPGELYLVNVDDDPGERVNRANDPEAALVRDRLLKLALDHLDDFRTR